MGRTPRPIDTECIIPTISGASLRPRHQGQRRLRPVSASALPVPAYHPRRRRVRFRCSRRRRGSSSSADPRRHRNGGSRLRFPRAWAGRRMGMGTIRTTATTTVGCAVQVLTPERDGGPCIYRHIGPCVSSTLSFNACGRVVKFGCAVLHLSIHSRVAWANS
jgi:hypothetical protein